MIHFEQIQQYKKHFNVFKYVQVPTWLFDRKLFARSSINKMYMDKIQWHLTLSQIYMCKWSSLEWMIQLGCR